MPSYLYASMSSNNEYLEVWVLYGHTLLYRSRPMLQEGHKLMVVKHTASAHCMGNTCKCLRGSPRRRKKPRSPPLAPVAAYCCTPASCSVHLVFHPAAKSTLHYRTLGFRHAQPNLESNYIHLTFFGLSPSAGCHCCVLPIHLSSDQSLPGCCWCHSCCQDLVGTGGGNRSTTVAPGSTTARTRTSSTSHGRLPQVGLCTCIQVRHIMFFFPLLTNRLSRITLRCISRTLNIL